MHSASVMPYQSVYFEIVPGSQVTSNLKRMTNGVITVAPVCRRLFGLSFVQSSSLST